MALLSAAGSTATGVGKPRESKRYDGDELSTLWRSLGKLLPYGSGAKASPQLIHKLVMDVVREPGKLSGVGAADTLRGMSDLGRWGGFGRPRTRPHFEKILDGVLPVTGIIAARVDSLAARNVGDALFAYAKLFSTRGMGEALPPFDEPEITSLVQRLVARCETVTGELSPGEAAGALWAVATLCDVGRASLDGLDRPLANLLTAVERGLPSMSEGEAVDSVTWAVAKLVSLHPEIMSKGALTPGLLAAIGAAIQKAAPGSIEKGLPGMYQVTNAWLRVSVLAEHGAMVPLGDGCGAALLDAAAGAARHGPNLNPRRVVMLLESAARLAKAHGAFGSAGSAGGEGGVAATATAVLAGSSGDAMVAALRQAAERLDPVMSAEQKEAFRVADARLREARGDGGNFGGGGGGGYGGGGGHVGGGGGGSDGGGAEDLEEQPELVPPSEPVDEPLDPDLTVENKAVEGGQGGGWMDFFGLGGKPKH